MIKMLKNSIMKFFALTLCLILATSSLLGCEFLQSIFSPEYEFYFSNEEKVLTEGDRWIVTNEEFDFSTSKPHAFSFTLTSSNEQVISVNSRTVVAVGEGETTLTATDDKGKIARCTVTVNKEISSLRLYASERSRHEK